MIRTLLLFLTLQISLFALSTKQLSHTINEAGRLRMLSQKIAKDALLLSQNRQQKREDEDIVNTLRDDTHTFDAILKGLERGDPQRKLKAIHDTKVVDRIHATSLLWQQSQKGIAQLLKDPTSKEPLKVIITQANPLTQSANQIVESLLELSREKVSSPRANSLNLAGKERMLSQKIAKALLAHKTQEAQQSLHEFKASLDGLIYGSSSLHLKATKLPKIRTKLIQVQQLLKEVECKSDIITLCDTLLKKMDHITKLFEKSIRREQKSLALSHIVNNFMEQKSLQSHAINLAGRERMLTQKLTKDALALSFDPEAEKSLTETIDTFDKTIVGLENGSKTLHLQPIKNRDAQKRLLALKSVWIPFKKELLLLQKNQGDLGWILMHDKTLLDASKALVKAIKQSSNNDLLQRARENIVDIAGSQRMLLQKITKARFMVDLHLNESTSQKHLNQAIKRFERQLHWLMHGEPQQKIPKPSNPKIIQAYRTILQSWSRLKPQFMQSHPQIADLVALNRQSDQLLTQIEHSVSLAETIREY